MQYLIVILILLSFLFISRKWVLLTLITVGMALFLSSCVPSHLPTEDIYFRVYLPDGVKMMKMEKGYLDEVNKGKAWTPCKDLKKEVEKK